MECDVAAGAGLNVGMHIRVYLDGVAGESYAVKDCYVDNRTLVPYPSNIHGIRITDISALLGAGSVSGNFVHGSNDNIGGGTGSEFTVNTDGAFLIISNNCVSVVDAAGTPNTTLAGGRDVTATDSRLVNNTGLIGSF